MKQRWRRKSASERSRQWQEKPRRLCKFAAPAKTPGSLAQFLAVVALLVAFFSGSSSAANLAVGSKTFGESHVLGEIIAQWLEANGHSVERKLSLGGTLITYEALRKGELDVYPEYSGTLLLAVLRDATIGEDGLEAALAEEGLSFAIRLGFNNSYGVAVPERLAEELGLQSIGDLAAHPELRISFTHEFLNREDGWPALQRIYQLPQQPSGIDHGLAYRALASGGLDATDAYTTDGELELFELQVLEDDRGVFPRYNAGMLIRSDMPEDQVAVLAELADRIDEETMRRLNFRMVNSGASPAEVAADFLREQGLGDGRYQRRTRAQRIIDHTLTHLQLTGIALGLACLLAVPLALLVSRWSRASAALQYAAGLIQTIPALALLALLIPLMGLGRDTAIFALFLYSLLPIVRNTLAGLAGIDPLLKEVAASMGMLPRQQLLRIELPLATPMILAGIKTAAIISIGTATLAAFVGAGGLGEPIITGLSLSDHGLILEGALPAAALAVGVEFVFELMERRLLPAQLRRD